MGTGGDIRISREKAKKFYILLLSLTVMSVVYGIANYQDSLLEISNVAVEMYGAMTTIAMFICLHCYGFNSKLIKSQTLVKVILLNVIAVGIYSTFTTFHDNRGLMTSTEILTLSSLYLVVYWYIINAFISFLRSLKPLKTGDCPQM